MFERKNSGITLIILVITIIMMLILAAVTVTITLNSGMLFKSKESAFKTDLKKYITDFQEYIETQGEYLTENFNQEGIDAETLEELIEYIPSFKQTHEGKFVIYDGQISYTNLLEDPEKTWAEELGIFKIIPITAQGFFEVNVDRCFNKCISRSKWRKNSFRSKNTKRGKWNYNNFNRIYR